MIKQKRNFFNKNAKELYFSHDCNARNDEKILQLRIKFGWEGYGLWWAILESLRTANNYKLKNEFISGLAYQLNYDVEKLREMINFCIDVGLLRSNSTYFWSNGLSNRMKQVDSAKEKMRAAGVRGAEKKYNKNYSDIDEKDRSNPIEDRFNEILTD